MNKLKDEINSYNRVINLYTSVVNSYINEKSSIVNQLAVIHAFEISLEVGLKVLKCILDENFIDVYSQEDVIKEAFSTEILTNGQSWIDMLQTRNIINETENIDNYSSHLDIISTDYFKELSRFREQLQTDLSNRF